MQLFNHLNIGRRLALCFSVLVAIGGVMGLVVLRDVARIEEALNGVGAMPQPGAAPRDLGRDLSGASGAAQEHLARIHWTMFVMLLLGLGVSGAAALTLSRSISEPLRELVRGAERMGEGDFSARLNVERRDELGEVAGAFNRLAERRESAERALHGANAELENRVAVRTAQLQAEVEERERSQNERDRFFNLSPDLMCVVGFDGVFRRVNQAWTRVLGQSADSLEGTPLTEVIHSGDHGLTRSEIHSMRSGDAVRATPLRIMAQGRVRWFVWSAVPVLPEGIFYAVGKDITEMREVGESLARYQLLADNTGDIMLFVALDGHILEANHAAERAYGWNRSALLALNIGDLRDPDTLTDFESQIGTASEGHTLFATRHRRRSGECFEVEVSSQVARLGGETVLLSVVRDVTERKKLEDQLAHQAFHDALTGLCNRPMLLEQLERASARLARRPERSFATLFLDLDRFKNINDSLGHDVGDQLLVGIAARLQECLRPGDVAARLGGDEFVLLLDDLTHPGDAIRVAERIHRELMKPFRLRMHGGREHEVFTGASIGIVLTSSAPDDPAQILRDADTAMYRAKARGRGCHEVFDTRMHECAVAQLQLETDLRHALEIVPDQRLNQRSEFEVHFQPIVALDSGELCSLEALVRWRHPERGLVSPGEFIPLAEETGLIVALDRHVLRQSCAQMRAWLDAAMWNRSCCSCEGCLCLSVSVNISARHWSRPDLVEHVALVLAETGLQARHLKLEITESALMENAEAAELALRALKSMGVQLYLDDFGTGYSSLSYLHRFPVDALKIDRSFVARMEEDREKLEIVRAIVALAHNLGIEVVAEGIETAAQREELHRLECKYGQGFLFSRPLPAAQIERFAPTPRTTALISLVA